MTQRAFYIEGEYRCSAPAPFERTHGELTYPIGLSFFCPLCARVWATALIVGEPSAIEGRACTKHRHGERLGHSSLGAVSTLEPCGSLLHSWRSEWNNNFPASLWKRELALTCIWAIETCKVSESFTEDLRAIYDFYSSTI